MNKKFISQSLSNNPSITVLIGLLSEIIPVIVFHSYPFYYILCQLLLIFSFITLLTNWQKGIKAVVWCIIGISISLFHNSHLLGNYSSQIPYPSCSSQIKAMVVDPEITGNTNHWLPTPKYIKMKIYELKYRSNDKWLKSFGLVNVLLLHNKNGHSDTLFYGDKIEMNGRFIEPKSAPFPGSFDYKKYLKSQGIDKIYICSNYSLIEAAGFPFNIYRKIYSFRNSALNYLCDGIKFESTKVFLAGFFFGCRQGIDNKMKEIFLRSGTIHILAISGLHIGILALILLFILRALPTTPRYMIIPLLLLCYVFLTGSRPSGVRALVMISIFCFHKAFFYSIRPTNSIAFAAVMILLFNPFAINNTGFQFSFIIAGFLVISWEKTNYLLRIIKEKENWIISAPKTLFKKIKNSFKDKVILLTVTSSIAGIAGTGLILYYQSLLIPSMILSNILILPLLLPLFIIGFVKIFTFFLFGKSIVFLNILLNWIIQIIYKITSYGAYSAYTKYYQQPSAIFLIFFFCLLSGIFLTYQKKKAIIYSCLIGVIAILWISSNVFSSGKVTILQGAGNQPPSIIIKPNSYNKPILINCPVSLEKVIISKLRKEGINSLGKIVITKSSKKYSGGIPYLLSKIPTKQLILPKKVRKTKLFKEIILLCAKLKIDVVYLQKTINIQDDFTWKVTGSEVNIKVLNIHPGFKKLFININNGEREIFNIRNSNFIQIYECPIPGI